MPGYDETHPLPSERPNDPNEETVDATYETGNDDVEEADLEEMEDEEFGDEDEEDEQEEDEAEIEAEVDIDDMLDDDTQPI